MKRILPTLILLVLCFTNAFGSEEKKTTSNSNIKSFVNESKVWHWLQRDYVFDTYNDNYFCFEGDTVINGIQAKEMYLKNSKDSNHKVYYAALYEDGDKVYCCSRMQNDFSLLYDFGAEIGEEISIVGLNYNVLDVENIIIDNEPLRVLHLSVIENSIRYIVTWVQGFGCTSYPSYEYSFAGDYIYHTDFANCEMNEKVVLEAENIPTPNLQEPYSPNTQWVGAVWSYYSYDDYPENTHSYFRYTVLDRPEVIDGLTYYPLVKYTTCEYEEGKEEAVYRIRQEGERIYMRKEDFADSTYLGPIFQEVGNDYIFYDFSLKEGDEYCKLSYRTPTSYPLTVLGVNEFKLTDNQYVKRLLFCSSVGEDSWIAGIGSTYDLLEPFTNIAMDCYCSRTLNYFCTADSSLVYRNPRTKTFGDRSYYDHFKEDDCALNPSNIGEVADVSPFIIQANNGVVSCTSPTATKLEVYTMDAVKVGESAFANGEASVKVSRAPATYLYIVTYSNGQRESGKAVVN